MENHNNVGNTKDNNHLTGNWTNGRSEISRNPLTTRNNDSITIATNGTSSSNGTSSVPHVPPLASTSVSPLANSVCSTSQQQQQQSGEDSDDDYYVYTYKGDNCGDIGNGMADLPSSFFKFDSSDSHPRGLLSNNSKSSSLSENARASSSLPLNQRNGSQNGALGIVNNGTRQTNGNVFSPDMDFLEMDFDPDVNAEEDAQGEEDDEDVVLEAYDSTGEAEEECAAEDEDNLANLAQNCHLNNHHSEENVPKQNSSNSKPKTSSSSASSVYSSDSLSSQPSTSSSCHVRPFFNNPMRFNFENNSSITKSDSTGTSKGYSNKKLDTLKVSHSGGGNISSNNNNNNSGSECSSALLQDNCSTNNLIKTKSANHQTTTTLIPSNFRDPHLSPLQRENQLSARLVKSITLPEIGQPSGSSSFSNSLLSTTRSSTLFSSGPVFGDSDKSYRAVINTSQSSKVAEDLVELNVGRVMIWDEEEAKRISFSQIGKSACGATAVLNVLCGLNIDCSPELINKCVGTRLRAEDADLPQYLFSRSNAGATHLDLINGVQKASNDMVYARFFHINSNIPNSKFSKWLLYWICNGAIPVATRNMQILPSGSYHPHEIPDAWHHQMLFGVCPTGVFMVNPVECVPLEELLPQLSSESLLLIRRQDIISRKRATTDLRQLARHSDPRWNELNVLGQVANILLEEIPIFNENSAARRVRSSHITIPCAYQAGITIFIRRDSPFCQKLMEEESGP